MPWCQFQIDGQDRSVKQLLPVFPKLGDIVCIDGAAFVVTNVTRPPTENYASLNQSAMVYCRPTGR